MAFSEPPAAPDPVAGEDPLLGKWGSSWEADLSRGDEALRQTLLSHLITAKFAARLMIKKRRGLIVEVTEGDMLMAGGNLLSGLVKGARALLAFALAAELRPHWMPRRHPANATRTPKSMLLLSPIIKSPRSSALNV